MNWCEHVEEFQSHDENSPVEPEFTHTLFLGDSGELALDARRVLVQLLAGPLIDGNHHSKLWSALKQNEALIRGRLAELFLELVIDKEMQVAFTRQADTGDLEVPSLLRRAQLTFIDSVMLLYLRQRLMQADAECERAVISTEEITEYLMLYERTANTDRAGFEKRVHASIEKIKKYSILQKIRASDNRFKISPTLKLLFSVEKIQALTQLYKNRVNQETIDPDSQELVEKVMQ